MAVLRAWPAWFWLSLLALLGAALRVAPWLAVYPLHRDEALYGSWARLVLSGSDPGLTTVWVDKPPLVIYLLAGSMGLLGASELALRLPGMLASLALLPVTYGLGRALGGRRLGLLAMAIAAASPFAILFSPTAFTDPWLSLWLACAALAALVRRPFLSGLCAGLAIASKQTGILGLPLVMLLLWAGEHMAGYGPACPTSRANACRPRPERPGGVFALWGRATHTFGVGAAQTTHRDHAVGSTWSHQESRPRPRAAQALGSALLGLVLALAPVVWWDSLRWATRPSFWSQSLQTYGGLGLASPAVWPGRAAAWAQQIGYLFGRPPATAAMLLLAGLGAVAAGPGDSITFSRLPFSCSRFTLVAIYVLGYLGVHFFLTFQPWDRYLLPLVPLLSVLAAQGSLRAWSWLRAPFRGAGLARGLGAGGLAALLLWGAKLGATGALPVGSDYAAFAGLDQVVATLRSLPWSAVVYERSLGWHLDFYMFDSPPPHIWWDQPATLAADAQYGIEMMPQRQQWLVLATSLDEQAGQQAAQALTAHGLALVERKRIGPAAAGQACACPAGDLRCQCPLATNQTTFIIYQIVPADQRPAQAASGVKPHG